MSSSRRATPRRAGLAVLGGTFDRFHVGHEALLRAAFRAGRRVSIGITTPRFLAEHPKPLGGAIEPFSTRAASVRRFLRRTFPRRSWTLRPLDDAFGGSLEDGIGVLVVSDETARGGRAVNEERRRRGRPALPVVVVPTVFADDLEPVSSRRIRAGAIDRRGRRRSPIEVGVAAAEPRVREAVSRALVRAFPGARFVETRAAGGRGAITPARVATLAGRASRGRDLGVAAGLRRGGWIVALRSGARDGSPQIVRGVSTTELSRELFRRLRARGAKRR